MTNFIFQKFQWIFLMTTLCGVAINKNDWNYGGKVSFFSDSNLKNSQHKRIAIDFVSTFNFFKIKSTKQETNVFYALPQRYNKTSDYRVKKGPNFIQVSDSTKQKKSWRVTLKAENQTTEKSQENLQGSNVTLKNNYLETTDSQSLVKISDQLTLSEGDILTIMSVNSPASPETEIYSLRWGKDLISSKESVSWYLPNQLTETIESHSSTFLWTLEEVPL